MGMDGVLYTRSTLLDSPSRLNVGFYVTLLSPSKERSDPKFEGKSNNLARIDSLRDDANVTIVKAISAAASAYVTRKQLPSTVWTAGCAVGSRTDFR